MKISQFSKTFKRNWLLFALLIVVVAVFGTILVLTRPKTFEASTLVQVSFTTNNVVEGVPDYDTRATIFNTIIEASTTNVALRSVGAQTGWDTQDLKEIRQAIKVFQVNKSEFIKITVEAKTEKQALDTTNNLATYIRNFSNQRWAFQLRQNEQFTEGQLKLAQDNFDKAQANYTTALSKFKDLQSAAEATRQKQTAEQVQGATDQVQKAQEAYATALTHPEDTVSIELTKNGLDRAQRTLETAQLAALTPIDRNQQAQLNDTFNQVSGIDTAQTNLRIAKTRLDELLAAKDTNALLFALPDLHLGSVNVSEVANTADPQSRQVVLFIGLSVGTAVVLSLLLLLALSYFNRSIYSLVTARELYPWSVIGGIPQWKIKKGSLPQGNLMPGIKLRQPGISDSEMDSYRQLAYKMIANHRMDLKADQSRTPLLPETASSTKLGTDITNPDLKAEVNQVVTDDHSTTLERWVAGEPKSTGIRFLVTTSLARNGSTTLVKNLGIAMAEAGCRTLLVDCNRKRPELLNSFNIVDADTGLKVYPTEVAQLDVLAYSSLPVQANGLIHLADLTNALSDLTQTYQVIICDSPAFEEASDALVLAQYFQNVLYVVNGKKSSVEIDHERLHNLMIGYAQLEGLVVNRLAK